MKRSGIVLALVLGIPLAALALDLSDLTNSIDTKALEKTVLGDSSSPDSIPLIGNPSDAEEQALGREVAGRLLGASPLVTHDELQRYVNRVGVYVAQQSGRPTLTWTFGIIQSEDINAFAAPGGYIFVTSGLYLQLQNEAELAGVLAHEVAHVNERHHVKLLQQARLLELGKQLALSGVKSDTVKGLAGNGVEVYARSLDKDAEFSCDRLAIQYAARAGYDPYAYISLLDRLGSGDATDKLALLYKTHPAYSDRLDALQNLVAGRWDKLAPGRTPERWVPLTTSP